MHTHDTLAQAIEAIEDLTDENIRLKAVNAELVEALKRLLRAHLADPYEIVGSDASGHGLNEEGVSRQQAYAALAGKDKS